MNSKSDVLMGTKLDAAPIFLRRVSTWLMGEMQEHPLAWLLIGVWALGMMSLPIILWTVGDGLLPQAVTVTTSLQAAAVIAVLAFTRLDDQFLALFFGYLAYTSYATLQAYFGPGGGLGGYRR